MIGGLQIRGLVLSALLLGPCPGPALAENLQPLVEQAYAGFHELIEPHIQNTPFLCTVEIDFGTPMREYVLQQYRVALDTLQAKADTPDNARRLRQVLGGMKDGTFTADAEAWLLEGGASDARGIRSAAALGELPAALDARMHFGCGKKIYGILGRSGKPLGALAESEYRRVAQLDAADPWNWLVLSWLAEERGEADIRHSLAAAKAKSDGRVELFAYQQLARLRQRQGRIAEADTALSTAAALAAQEIAGKLKSGEQERLAAVRDANWLAMSQARFLMETGRAKQASAILSGLLPIRESLAKAYPQNLPIQLELIGTLANLSLAENEAMKAGAAGTATLATEGKPSHLDQALALHKNLARQENFKPMFGPSSWSGMAAAAITLAGIATFVVGLSLIFWYRWRVGRLMMAAARAPRAVPPLAVARAVEESPGQGKTRRSHQQVAPFDAARGAQRRAAVTHIAAGVMFGILASILELQTSDTDITGIRLMVMTWAWGWPTILVLAVIWAGDGRRQTLALAAYFAGLLLICLRVALSHTPPMQLFGLAVPPFAQGLAFWLLSASPTVYLLLFLNRSVRSIGPPLLVMMAAACLGGTLAIVAFSSYGGVALMSRSLALLHIPVSTMSVLLGPFLLGMLLFAPLAWWLASRLRKVYAAKWISDQSLVIDTIWLFQSIMLCNDLHFEIGVNAWIGLAGFVLVKAIATIGMRPAVKTANTREPVRLLLLRVFGQRRHSERLFDLLSARWRYAGPIHMIAAPDLASSTLDPDEFLDFVSGRLRQHFIIEPDDLPKRLAELDHRCDPDARYRVTELFCGNDAWQPSVQALMACSDLVAMDLRGFSPRNRGCLFELQALLDHVDGSHITLLIDETTDQAFLRATLTDCMSRLAKGSPNMAGGASHPVFIDASQGEGAAVQTLMDITEERISR